jgi:hypothetical protein
MMNDPFVDDFEPVICTSRPKKIIKTPYRLESDLSGALTSALNCLEGVKCQKIKGTAYGKPTLDILGSKNGRLFWLEVKQPGKKPTKRQFNTMNEWIKVGCIATWTTDLSATINMFALDWDKITNEQLIAGFHDRG